MWLKKDTTVALSAVGSILASVLVGHVVFAKTAALEAMEIPEQEARYVFTGSEIVRREEIPVVSEIEELAVAATSVSKKPDPMISVPANTATAADIQLLEQQLADARRALAEVNAVQSKPVPVLTPVTPSKTTTQTAPVVRVKPSRTTRAS